MRLRARLQWSVPLMSRETDRDLMREVRDRYAAAIEADKSNRDRDHKDRLFYTGGDNQWPAETVKERRSEGRPCETYNRLPQFVKQVTGEIRQNKPAIRVLPVDGQTDPELAKIYAAIIRHIEAGCSAHRIYSKETEKAVVGGQGWWRIKADYCDDGFDQELMLEGIPNPLAVVCDPDARHPTRFDMGYGFVTELVSRKKFKASYPKVAEADFDGEGYKGWVEGEFVRIAEYWVKEEVGKERIFAFEDGRDGQQHVLSESEVREYLSLPEGKIEDAIADLPIKLKGQREVPRYEVKSRLVCGSEPLSDWQEWKGRYIPLVRVVGEEVEAGDQVFRHGLVHHAKAPQVSYNFARNASMERYGAAAKSPWLIALKQIPGAFKGMWENANRKNYPFLPYDPLPDVPPPQRISPPAIDAAAIQESQLAAEDMKATTGIYDAHLGAKSNETSGVAIDRRDAQGDTATYVYIDNMEAAIEVTGRMLVDLIPHYYSDQRVIRILGEDGEVEKFEAINKIMPDGSKWNDVTRGRYDVAVSTGPAYASKRQQAAEAMLKLADAPAIQQFGMDMIVRALDLPMGDKLADRLKNALPAGIDEDLDKEREEKGKGQQQQPSAEEMKMQAELQMKQADMQARQQESQIKLQLQQVDAQTKAQLAQAEAQARIELEHQKAAAAIELEREKARAEMQMNIERMAAEQQMAERRLAMEERLAERNAAMRERESETKLKANRPGGDLSK
jgi:hypothetical protein